MSYYRIKPANRGACLQRIEAARKVTQPKHEYWQDGAVRVIAPADPCDDLMGGAFRDAFPVHESPAWKESTPARNQHTGWYTDPDGITARDGTGLCWGMVAYLGRGRWLAGYTIGGTDCCAYHLDAFYDNELAAARAADSLAQSVAEKEREHQQRWQEARRLEDDVEEKTARLRELLALRHRKCLGYVRTEIAETIEAIRAMRAELATEYGDVL